MLTKDYWHDEASIAALTVVMFTTLIWTFIDQGEALFGFLHFYTPIWVGAVLAFAGKRYQQVKKQLTE